MNVSALNQGVAGIRAGMDALSRDAQTIAKNTAKADEPDATSALVNLTQDRLQVAASAKVVAAANDVLGTLLDTKA